MIDIIRNLKLPPTQKKVFEKAASIFQSHEPDALFMTPDDLAILSKSTDNNAITSNIWKEFLENPEIDIYINQAIAHYMKFEGRKSLKFLTTGNLSNSDITTAKAIIEKSQILEQNNTPKQTVVTMHVPKPTPQEPDETSTKIEEESL